MGCYCHTINNPPCSYCEGISVCDYCGRAFKYTEVYETDDGIICNDCKEENNDTTEA